MIITYSKGKLVLSPFEIQAILDNGIRLSAMVDDVSVHQDALVVAANAGSVSWSIKLDEPEQILQVQQYL
ncbi:DUF3389 family protein [Paraferrimonas sp. SM1919]|uniref:DUF3389 family protein n=1 Tax=Paraferrimonas sp. SM1919 TaxID=2662263 RepID=UPI0013D2D4DA|nr:DUF3389 family protein [Paraferrimonas sp. SM1919]